MHSSIVEEESDSWHSWQKPLEQILSLDFSQKEVSILVNLDLNERSFHSGLQYFENESDILYCASDFEKKHMSSRIMISWFFQGIALAHSNTFERMQRYIITAIHHHAIFLTFENSTWINSLELSAQLWIWFLTDKQKNISPN